MWISFVASLALGCALGLHSAAQPGVGMAPAFFLVGAGAVLFVVAMFCLQSAKLATHRAIVFFAAIVLGVGLARLHVSFAEPEMAARFEGQDVVIKGRVSGLTRQFALGTSFEFDVEHAGPDIGVRKLRLAWYQDADPGALTPGSLWQFEVRLRAPHGPVNFAGRDAELYLHLQGIQATGYVRPKAPRLRLPSELPARYWVDAFRHAAKVRIARALGESRSMGLIQALAVGDQSAVDRADWTTFRDTGVSHLMSISGLHITMVSALIGLLVTLAWGRSHWLRERVPAVIAANGLGLLGAFVYAVIAGFGIPAARTLMMLVVVQGARLFGLRFSIADALAIALLAVLLVEPTALVQPGFWLSFFAVGILVWSAQGNELASDIRPRTWFALRGFVRAQAVATVCLAPLSVLFFSQLSLVSPLANALAIPLVSLVITPLCVLGLALPSPLADGLWWLAQFLLELLGAALSAASALSFASIGVAAPSALAFSLAILGAGVAFMRPLGPLRAFALVLLLPLFLLRPEMPVQGEFTLDALDVGQGTAVLIRTAAGAVLYDAGAAAEGGFDAAEAAVVPALRQYGISHLEKFVVSHADTDHAGGAQSVLGAVNVHELISSITGAASALILHPKRTLAPLPCIAGQRFLLAGVSFSVLGPTRQAYDANLSTNAMSCILHIESARGRSVLLTGDALAAQEAQLARNLRPVDVLFIGHHGSQTSSSAELLDKAKPRFGVIQVGYRSRYRHPHPSVLARLASRGIAVLRTDCDGGLRWASDAPDRWVKARVERSPYWRHTCGETASASGRGTSLASTKEEPRAEFEETP